MHFTLLRTPLMSQPYLYLAPLFSRLLPSGNSFNGHVSIVSLISHGLHQQCKGWWVWLPTELYFEGHLWNKYQALSYHRYYLFTPVLRSVASLSRIRTSKKHGHARRNGWSTKPLYSLASSGALRDPACSESYDEETLVTIIAARLAYHMELVEGLAKL